VSNQKLKDLMRENRALIGVTLALASFASLAAGGEPKSRAAEDLRIDRETVYELAKGPMRAREGGKLEIRFASKARCDAAVTINGRTVRLSGTLPMLFWGPTRQNRSRKTRWTGKSSGTAIYAVYSGRRKYPDGYTTQSSSGILMKFSAGEEADRKGRGADWSYPHVSFVTAGCPCFASGSSFAVDHFGRSFVPEHFRGQVGVLDTAGNLVMHIGRYGNVDDGVPRTPDPKGLRAELPRSIGGDEVAIAHCMHVAAHTDTRLFISDIGNT
jgi:hypothetical protein